MRIDIGDFQSDAYPTDAEVKARCRPGAGADTCVWLMMGSQGWECGTFNRHPTLLDRWMKGQTNAKRDGCPEVQQEWQEALAATKA